jgi:crotonobetainyl-CoA:carnitine CoA-transferase CaiB-like acyl-CoA transferase
VPSAPRAPAPQLPLKGIRVIDLTAVWAGPFTTEILGDLGAEIVRVETVTRFSTSTRGMIARPTREIVLASGWNGRLYPNLEPGERPWNRHANFNATGRNKLAMTIDLQRPEGVEIFKRLAAVSDVFVENNSAGVVDRLGIGWDALRTVNPSLVMISLPAFGNYGPYSRFAALGNNVEALTGFTLLRGYRDGDPTTAGQSYHMDNATGAGAAYAVLLALYRRRRTGRGQFIEFAQAENMLPHIGGGPIMDYVMNGRNWGAFGNRDFLRAPQGVYPSRGEDRWLALSVGTEAEWQGLCRALGKPELVADPRFLTPGDRQANQDTLDAIIAAWSRDLEHYDAFHRLQAEGVPAGPVIDDAEAFADPHIHARGFFHEMTHAEAGTHPYPGHPFRYTRTPLRFDSPAPLLGEHNAFVYKELLGYSDADYDRLAAENHIGTEFLPSIP